MNLLNPMVFQTTRLCIRPLTETDFPAFHAMHTNPNVMQYTSRRHTQTLEENKTELNELIANYAKPDNTFWVWAVERKSDQAFLGTCAFIVNEDNEYEIGFRLAEAYWGKGYGTEVAIGLIDYAMALPEVPGLVAYVFSENIGSVRVLERTAMVLEREFYNEKEKCLDRVYRLNK